jgi:hypothetical protein
MTYGFQPETLADPAPDRLFDSMPELADWLLEGGALSPPRRGT